jgi:hypothetical protein
VTRRERDEARRERDAALAREARLATAAAEVVRQVLGDDPSWWTPERRQDAANMVTTKVLGLHDALTATSSPAEHGERVLREAEERGAAWQRVADARSIMESAALHPGGRVGDVGDPTHPLALATRDCRELPFPAEVCRTARKEGTR